MDEQAPNPAPKKSLITPSRVVLLILLAVAVGALAVDVTARRAATAANDTLEAAIDETQRRRGDGKLLTRVEVHGLLGREPDAEQQRPDVEVYTWRGALKDYKVYARYSKVEPPTLLDVYLNKTPD